MNPRAPTWFASFPLLALLWWSPGAVALEVEDVARLESSGYSDEDILEVIGATRSEFLLSARDVVYLHQSGVAEVVILDMLVALPTSPAASGAAEPVRLKFMQEDLQLLAENGVPEPIIVTFIDTRDMAFTLDTTRLTALRDAGLGLDALQLLVEKSAAATPVTPPAPPAPAPMLAGYDPGYTTTPTYFYGRSHQDFYSPPPSVLIRTTYFSPWYVSGYHGGFHGSGFHYGPSYDPYPGYYYPRYVYGYPYGGYGYHNFYCPRGPHSHGHDHDRDHGRDRDWDRGHDRDRDKGAVFHAGNGNPDRDDVRDDVRDDRRDRGGKVVNNRVSPDRGSEVRGIWNGTRPAPGNAYEREATPQTHTFKVLGTQPLYGRSAPAVTARPATATTFTVKPATPPAKAVVTPAARAPDKSGGRTVRPVVRAVTSAERTTVPGSTASFTASPTPRAPSIPAAPAVAGREAEERSGGFRARSGEATGRDGTEGGRWARPR